MVYTDRFSDQGARLMAKTDRTPGGCWLWTARINNRGYGEYSLSGQRKLAHRASYELLVGPIPDGHELDHLCRTPRCVNPAHLEPVTHLENMGRSVTATKTHCKNGHEFDAENTRLDRNGHRRCRACRTIASRNRSAA